MADETALWFRVVICLEFSREDSYMIVLYYTPT